MGGVKHLIDLGGGHVLGVHTADAFAVEVDLEHDLGGRFAVLVEELLQHQDHELHGRVVVIEHHDLVHLGGFGALSDALQDNRSSFVVPRRDLGCGWFLGGHGVILMSPRSAQG